MAITEWQPQPQDQVTRPGWQCPGCGTHYSPDVRACSCSAFAAPSPPPLAPMPAPANCTCGPWNSITPPPPCPVHFAQRYPAPGRPGRVTTTPCIRLSA